MASEPVAARPWPGWSANATGWWRYRVLIGIAGLVLLSLVVHWPALKGGFLWDDDVLLIDNPLVRAPDGLYRIWFTKDAVDYWPVSNSTLWVEWRLWGSDPTGYHVTNLLFHIATALLVWLVLYELGVPGAYLGAILFAVHPVNVESVAWIAQRKTVMATMFALASVWAYVKALAADEQAASRATWGWYAASWLAFVLGMLSKGSIATLPIALLACAWWRRGRLTWRDLMWIAPFFLTAVPLILVNIWFQTHGVEAEVRLVTPLERLLGAGLVPWFYFYKALLPIGLIFIYPQWEIKATNPLWWLPLLACVAVTVALWSQRDRSWCRALLFAWICFCALLVPVMGFTDVAFMAWSLVSDHYQYAAIVAVVATVAAALSLWQFSTMDGGKTLAIGTSLTLVGTLALLSHQQSKMYLSAESHWQATIDLNPTCHVAYNNLGSVLIKQHRSGEALPLIEKALELNADNPAAEVNMGLVLLDLGRSQASIEHFHRALQLWPDYPLANMNLGGALVTLNRPQDAIPYLERALKVKPEYPSAETNLGVALLKTDRPQEAAAHLERALRFTSKDAGAHKNLGNVLVDAGRYQEAADQFAEAARLDPQDVEARLRNGVALFRLNRLPEAKAQFDAALAINPSSATVRGQLAAALMEVGQTDQALAEFQQATALESGSADAQNNLGGALLGLGRLSEALACFDRAIALAPDNADAHNNRGAALSRLGQMPEAIACYEKALALKPRFARAHNNLAGALLKTGKSTEAFAHFEQALALEPDLIEAHMDLGRALGNADRPQEAVAHFEHALRLKPNDVEIETNLASALANCNRQAEAISHLERALERKPDFVMAWINLAMSHAQVQQTDQAAIAAERALQLARAQNQPALVAQVEALLAAIKAQSAPASSAVPSGPALPP